MKTYILTFALICLPGLAHAKSTKKFTQEQMQKISTAETAHDYASAMQSSAFLVDSLYKKIKVGEMVAEVSSRLSILQKEVVVRSENNSAEGGFEFNFFHFLSARFSGGQKERVNFTEMVNTNPQNVAEFSSHAERDFAVLQTKVKNYLGQNSAEIAAIKLATLKFLENAVASVNAGDLVLISEARRLSSMALDIGFYGEQRTQVCTMTRYAGYKNKDGSQFGGGLGALWSLLKIQANFSENESTEHKNYSEQECEDDSQTVAIKSEDSVYRFHYAVLDDLIQKTMGYLDLSATLKSAGKPYPVFNNEYLRAQ